MVSVYIAAPYAMREYGIRVALRLAQAKITVISRWLEAVESSKEEAAYNSLVDIDRASLFLALNPEGWEEKGTGGCHVEFGYALARGKRILLVGDPSNVFHHLNAITVIDETMDVVRHIQLLAKNL